MLPGLTSLAGLSASGVTLINRGVLSVSSSNLTTYTFSAYGIGAASSSRRVIAYITGETESASGRTLSSATIGGVSATIDAQITAGSSNSVVSAIISATVPTGTTADIVATFSGAMQSAAVAAVAVDGLLSATPHDTLTDTSDPNSGTIDWLNGGFVIGGSAIADNTLNCTWVGLTERDEAISDTFHDSAFADLFPTSTATGQTVSATWGFPYFTSMAVASYR